MGSHVPQIIWLCLNMIGMGVVLVKHGEETKYNFGVTLLATLINIGLLWWGGFFS